MDKAHDLGDPIVPLPGLCGLGHVLHAQSRYNEAEDTYRQVLDLSRAVGNRNFQFEAISGLGRLHQATGRPIDALACHTQALEIATELGQVADQARAHDGLARGHCVQGDAGPPACIGNKPWACSWSSASSARRTGGPVPRTSAASSPG